MELSIVITTRNRKKDLLNCLSSILKSSFKGFEIIIIDDCSSDGTKDLRKDSFRFKNIKIIHSKKQLMMVGARNLGAKTAKGKYILFVDDDNIFTKEAIGLLVDCAKKEKDYGIIGLPIYFYKDKRKYLSSQKFNFFTGRTRAVVKTNKKCLLLIFLKITNVSELTKDFFEKYLLKIGNEFNRCFLKKSGHFFSEIRSRFEAENRKKLYFRNIFKCGFIMQKICC